MATLHDNLFNKRTNNKLSKRQANYKREAELYKEKGEAIRNIEKTREAWELRREDNYLDYVDI